MAHIEVLINVDHRRTDGLEEVHSLEVRVDGVAAGTAWGRTNRLVQLFLDEEDHAQTQVNLQVQAAEGPWCNHNWYDPTTSMGYLCNLPPDHRTPHENFASGRRWPQNPRKEQET